jgi:hypothetical protein
MLYKKYAKKISILAISILSLHVYADPNISYSLESASNEGGYDKLTFPITVNKAQFTGRNYYYALNAWFLKDTDPKKSGSAIYIGLQPREPGQNLVIFSTFGTGTTALSSNCKQGADGGSGTSCSIRYNWDLDTPYVLTMQKEYKESTDRLNVWSGHIKNQKTLESIEIGRFSVPKERLGISSSLYHFNEYFPFNNPKYKNPADRPCIPYSKITVSSPTGYLNDKRYPTTKVNSVRLDAGKDSCSITQNKLTYRVTKIPNTFNYISETGVLTP